MMNMNRFFLLLACALLLCAPVAAVAQEAKSPKAPVVKEAPAQPAPAVVQKPQPPTALFWAIGITMAGGSLAAGFAVAKVGSAALGAAAERPELLGKAIAFVGLGEGIALFGFLISLFLYLKI